MKILFLMMELLKGCLALLRKTGLANGDYPAVLKITPESCLTVIRKMGRQRRI